MTVSFQQVKPAELFVFNEQEYIKLPECRYDAYVPFVGGSGNNEHEYVIRSANALNRKTGEFENFKMSQKVDVCEF